MVSDLLPPMDLTELLLEINAHTGFANEFFHANEASARVDDLPVSKSALLMAETYRSGTTDQIKCSCTDPTSAEPDKSEHFVSDQDSGFHDIVILGTLRDATFVLEGHLEQKIGLDPTEIMTNKAGASVLVFGLSWLLGYTFSPRLADAGASVFWRMDHDADDGVLNDIARGQSDLRKRILQWDEMIRTAGSLKLGKVPASVLVRSLLKSECPSGTIKRGVSSRKRC